MPDASRGARAELATAAAFFILACTAFVLLAWRGELISRLPALLLFTLLVGSYLGLGVQYIRPILAEKLPAGMGRWLLGPALLVIAAVGYAAAVGLPIAPRLATYSIYLFAPALLVMGRPGSRGWPLRALAAVILLWLPIEFDLLPPLPIPPQGGYDVVRFLALVLALYLFLLASPLEGVGYTFYLERKDLSRATLALLIYAVVALPLGLATGFLVWEPDITASQLLWPFVIFLVTALPEEFLFRGVIQNLLGGWMGRLGALAVASVVFGLAHLPDPRYALLATLAGVAYGWVYLTTGKITAAAVTHTGVDWVWGMALGG